MPTQQADRSLCKDCAAGDHGNHRRLLADICVGCSCPETPHKNERENE